MLNKLNGQSHAVESKRWDDTAIEVHRSLQDSIVVLNSHIESLIFLPAPQWFHFFHGLLLGLTLITAVTPLPIGSHSILINLSSAPAILFTFLYVWGWCAWFFCTLELLSISLSLSNDMSQSTLGKREKCFFEFLDKLGNSKHQIKSVKITSNSHTVFSTLKP